MVFAAVGYLIFRSFAAGSLTKVWDTDTDFNTGTKNNVAIANNSVTLQPTGTVTPVGGGTSSGPTVTLQPGTVDHTLPDKFFGVSAGGYSYNLLTENQQVIDLVNGLQPEFWRMVAWTGTWGIPTTPSDIARYRQDFARMTTTYNQQHGLDLPGFFIGTSAAPSSQNAQPYYDPNNVNTADRSPATAAAWMKWWTDNYPAVNGKKRIVLWEAFNEPATAGNTTSCRSTDWYCGDKADYYAEYWASIHLRNYSNAVKNALSGVVSPPTFGSFGYADAGTQNGDGGLKWEILGKGAVPSWPFADTNIPYMDAFTTHAYSFLPGGVDNRPQASINQIFYPSYDAQTYKGGYQATLGRIRSILDANGGQNTKIAETEWEPAGSGLFHDGYLAPGALGDTAIAIVSANQQKNAKLELATVMDVDPDDITLNPNCDITKSPCRLDEVILRQGGSTYIGSVRYYELRDMTIPFIHNYKDQISSTTASLPRTPATTVGNSVDAIQYSAGLNSSHSKMGILIGNYDMTNAHSVTINLGTTASGSITGKRMLQNMAINTPIPSITPFGSGQSSITLNMAAGEADFLEVPITSTPGTTFPSSGSITLTHDAGQTVDWATANAGETKPAGTNITYAYQSSIDNTSWSNPTSDITSLANSRYIKVTATLSTTNNTVTPSLDKLTVAYDALSSPPITPSISIPAASATHTVDGNLNEADWNLNTNSSKTVFGTSNNTVTYGVLWDNNNLYVGMKVLDNSLKNDSGANVWDDDSVEVYVDPTNAGGATYTPNDRQFIKGWNNSTIFGTNTTGVQHAWAAISGGYTIEIAIPWSNLGVTPSTNMTIGLDVGNNDDDNGGTRDAQVMWAGTFSNYVDPSGWGKATLTGSPASAKTGDLNSDGNVNIQDLSILLSHYGQSGTGDINNDGTVNIVDLSILMSNFGK